MVVGAVMVAQSALSLSLSYVSCMAHTRDQLITSVTVVDDAGTAAATTLLQLNQQNNDSCTV
jgi:hypothetical protein